MPVEREVRLARQNLDADNQVGITQIYVPVQGRLDPPPHLSLYFGRGQGVRLVGAPGGHPEAARLAAVQISEDGGSHLVQVAADAARRGEIGDAEHPSETLPNGLPLGVRTGRHLDPAHDRPHAGTLEVRQGRAYVRHEPLDEPGAVPPLQGDLLVANDDRFHALIA